MTGTTKGSRADPDFLLIQNPEPESKASQDWTGSVMLYKIVKKLK